MVLFLLRGCTGSPEEETPAREPVTHAVPARFPQLWRKLFTNISYQPSVCVPRVPGVYKQNSFGNFSSAIHGCRACLLSRKVRCRMRVRVPSGWLMVHAWEMWFDLKIY